MNTPLLSILIPTVVGREKELESLLWGIKKQHDYEIGLIGGYGSSEVLPVEVFWITDNKEMTIGEKREYMYSIANGIYSWQIDDDDDISHNAIELILSKIMERLVYDSGVHYINNLPDCITFQEHCMINGVHYKSNHSLDYGDWEGDGQRLLADEFHYHRTPFMKSVIKTEIAKSVPIPHIRFGEDHQWAQALKPHLKTEVHIPEDIYFYQHISSQHNERYGIK
jgi:hypothetical protein